MYKEGLIRLDDIDMILSMQKRRSDSIGLAKSRLFGMILCDMNLITPLDNYCILHKYNNFMSIPSALISQKILAREVVEKTVEYSKNMDIPLISCLIETDLISTDQMNGVLYDLFHIPLRTIRDFHFAKDNREKLAGMLTSDQARKERMIPLVLQQNTLLFGITDPENLLSLQKLNNRFPRHRIKSVFIPVAVFSRFFDILYDNTLKPPLSSREKSLDLSLLLNFKTVITDPEKETESVRVLYERYELLRHLIGNPKKDNRQDAFMAFIRKNHRNITAEYRSLRISFSLKKEGENVKIIALPIH